MNTTSHFYLMCFMSFTESGAYKRQRTEVTKLCVVSRNYALKSILCHSLVKFIYLLLIELWLMQIYKKGMDLCSPFLVTDGTPNAGMLGIRCFHSHNDQKEL